LFEGGSCGEILKKLGGPVDPWNERGGPFCHPPMPPQTLRHSILCAILDVTYVCSPRYRPRLCVILDITYKCYPGYYPGCYVLSYSLHTILDICVILNIACTCVILLDIRAAFDLFDLEHEGFIDPRKLMRGSRTLGLNLSEAEVQNLIAGCEVEGMLAYLCFGHRKA